MQRLIFTGLLLVALILLFAVNGQNTTDLNLFWHTFEAIPTVVVALGGIIVGILYSIVVVALGYLRRLGRGSGAGRSGKGFGLLASAKNRFGAGNGGAGLGDKLGGGSEGGSDGPGKAPRG